MTHPFFEQKELRRRRRLAAFSDVRGAVKSATSGWDLQERLNGETFGRPSTLTETIKKAVAVVRDTFNQIGEFPIPPVIEYQSIRHVTAAAGGTEQTPLISDGTIMLQARFLTKTGVRDSLDVPVLIREGQVVAPSVFMHEGTMKILAPSSIRDLVARGTFTQQAPSRGIFSGPLSHNEIQQWNRIERETKNHTRLNPGMFAVNGSRELLRAAVRGDGAFDHVRQAQLGEQPSRAHMGFKATPGARIGDRIVTFVHWEPERLQAMSDHNILHAIRSFVLELGSKKEWRDWGTIADVQIDEFDTKDGSARVSFKSSEISAPQLSAADLEDLKTASRTAAIGPSQDATHLEPAERDKAQQFHIGEEVKLTKGQLLRNRGGGTDTVPKGTTGRVVGDMFGDGLTLKIVFDSVSDQPMVIPASHVKHASSLTAEKIVKEIENLRHAGYAPIDVILTARERYGALGETALAQAKEKGLLDW